MKLDVNVLRYLSKEEFRVLTAIEMGMKNHEIVPAVLVERIANLKRGGAFKHMKTLLKHKLVHHDSTKYNGYRLTTMGYDFLAIKTFTSRGIMIAIGRKIGVGKESDIFEAIGEDGKIMVLKIHRLGRTSFRAVKDKRDYLKHRSSFNWLYLSRLAALKEFAFLKALGEHNFPVPEAIDHNRHCVLMSLVDAFPLVQVKGLENTERIFCEVLGLIVKLAKLGLIHCDFNEFNLLIDDDENITMIDFPQMVSVSHRNAKMYFDRDVECIFKFFGRRFNYSPKYEVWEKILNGDTYEGEEKKEKEEEEEEENEKEVREGKGTDEEEEKLGEIDKGEGEGDRKASTSSLSNEVDHLKHHKLIESLNTNSQDEDIMKPNTSEEVKKNKKEEEEEEGINQGGGIEHGGAGNGVNDGRHGNDDDDDDDDDEYNWRPNLHDIPIFGLSLDKQLEASGFTSQNQTDLEQYADEHGEEENEEKEEEEEDDDDDDVVDGGEGDAYDDHNDEINEGRDSVNLENEENDELLSIREIHLNELKKEIVGDKEEKGEKGKKEKEDEDSDNNKIDLETESSVTEDNSHQEPSPVFHDPSLHKKLGRIRQKAASNVRSGNSSKSRNYAKDKSGKRNRNGGGSGGFDF